MMLERRSHYPKVKVYGLWYARRQPKNDPLLREIQEAVKGMSVIRQVSSEAVILAEGQTAEKGRLAGSFQQPSQSSI
jgi:hypothetical protein